MEIVEKNVKDGAREYKFDNGAWVKLDIDGEYGSWEYQEDEDDEETYMEGGIWFDGKQIEDYDGCFELPEEVVAALNELGYSLDD
ncbi:hypothetical protein SAMN04487900_11074 [Prevotella communis]|uniref:Uncharacterized protein n=1 Tax=Prevotella communis TaxID=2913614 RepID=A0A1H0H1H2_9BACT|nr:hypothetical protein [Prevotella communis]SDO12998.1 hypothetical protein SAMN04487900_11074 [Prevotella communis]